MAGGDPGHRPLRADAGCSQGPTGRAMTTASANRPGQRSPVPNAGRMWRATGSPGKGRGLGPGDGSRAWSRRAGLMALVSAAPAHATTPRRTAAPPETHETPTVDRRETRPAPPARCEPRLTP